MDNIEQLIDQDILPFIAKRTADLLCNDQAGLKSCKWQDNESNPDTDFSNLSRDKCTKALQEIMSTLKKEIKIQIETPDLLITFNDVYKRRIELKSTKSSNGKMPGSTIGKKDWNEWVIFCHRSDNLNDFFEIRYGRYYEGLKPSDYELFQDRTPRPSLNFNQFHKPEYSELIPKIEKQEDFYKNYATCAINRVLGTPPNKSWQDDLVKEIIKIVKNNPEDFNQIE